MSARDSELMPPPSLVLKARHDASVNSLDSGSATPPEVPRKDNSTTVMTPRKIEKGWILYKCCD